MAPMVNHITKNTSLHENEKRSLNKCQTVETRLAAYNLLLTIAKECP